MRNVIAAAVVGVALFGVPAAAFAQGTTTDSAPKATDLKGPPNAAGYGKDKGIETQDPVVGGAGSSAAETPSATNMHGSPNANGYKK